MNILRISSLLPLLLVLGSLAHAQTESCGVTTYFLDLEARSSSSWFLVGRFPLKLEGDAITKQFIHAESGVNISVGVEQVIGIFEGEPRRMRIAMSFIGKPEDVFDEIESAGAESIYDKNWRWLSVSKNLQVANRIYTFRFGCERNKQRRSR
jgi:hypothetical protein